jgi:membrane associated rhomboid family serine protease
MFNRDQSDDYRPLFWVSGRPVYVNTLIVGLHVAAFVAIALLIAVFGADFFQALPLIPSDVIYHGEVWRLFTYIIFPPGSGWDVFNFIIAMLLLIFFGRQVEQYIGRRTYIVFYIALVLIPAVLLSLLSLVGVPSSVYLNGFATIFGVFIAFATLYPGMELAFFFVNMNAALWAYVLLGLYSVCDIAFHDWTSLGVLWIDAAVGYLGMRLVGAGYGMTWLTDWIEERRAARLAKKHNLRVMKESKESESIDEILEKISKQGVGSLTAKERAALERARANLLKRDKS